VSVQNSFSLKIDDLYKNVKSYSPDSNIDKIYKLSKTNNQTLLIVLDDDPTGIQTVHNVNVYMIWSQSIMDEIFEEEDIVFIQTNSRSLTQKETKELHLELMKYITNSSQNSGRKFSIISRSDSTLRGHYPLETEIIRQSVEKLTSTKIDAEILIPSFFESGRFTYQDIHYVQYGNDLIPVAMTEFAKDNVFGYQNSDLKDYIEEKTNRVYKSEHVISISLDLLRNREMEKIIQTLVKTNNFQKIIVNALSYDDLKIFCIALSQAEKMGKTFIFRTAASFVKIYGFIDEKHYLTKKDLDLVTANTNGPIITIVGSHVNKSTDQLNNLLNCKNIVPFEINVENILRNEHERTKEIALIVKSVNEAMENKRDSVLYTSRDLIKSNKKAIPENDLYISRTISHSLAEIINQIKIKPYCLISKGGITSSDVGTKGLGISKAKVLGQIHSGIPVVIAGNSKKWAQMPYIIFPGNVGDENTLREIYNLLKSD
jgi:uncharacterized protein YgbK (DUF1537 family)